MQIAKILERINLDGNKTYEPTLEVLTLLQKQYLLNVPYENIDFILNKGISVNLLKIYEKIIENNRGGICYESNTLFIYLLKTLGFKVQMIFAKVEDLTYIGKDYPHLAILATIDEKIYLVDVANGQNVREPMPIDDENYICVSENIEYKIKFDNAQYTLYMNAYKKGWKRRYHFTTDIKRVSDFEDIFETSSDMKDSKETPLLITLAKDDGRVTICDNIITVKEGDNRRSWEITKENKAEVLRDYFKMQVDTGNK